MLGTTGAALTYATAPLLGIFSDSGFADAVLQFERAVLRVEEELGLVPLGEAAKLALFQPSEFDLAAASAAAISTSNPVVGLVEQLHRVSPYAHFGITSHDAWDVAHVLQLRTAIKLVLADVRVVVERLAGLVETHATTPMVARTQGQAGAPTTLGFKLATWLDELVRAAERLTNAVEDGALITIAGAAFVHHYRIKEGRDRRPLYARHSSGPIRRGR